MKQIKFMHNGFEVSIKWAGGYATENGYNIEITKPGYKTLKETSFMWPAEAVCEHAKELTEYAWEV